ncbi:MAG: HD domain-containing protein [Candidatus Gracilibacteria bacterium]|nr:HD domain-containing protein [Candidatus Gracilibacteria bacterium]
MYSLTEATELLEISEKFGSGNTGDKGILSYNAHKVRHTLGVLEVGRHIIIKLKERINLSDELINKAEICFMLHDLGRFYQNNGERVFNNEEFEHGDKSYELVEKAGYEASIYLAIKYHNKYSTSGLFEEKDYISMSKENKEEAVFLTNILRDADKLQNMLYSVFNISHLQSLDVYGDSLKNEDISPINIEDVKIHKLIDRRNIKTIGDYILSSRCFAFDMNFNETIEILKFFGYFDKIYALLEANSGVSKESLEIVRNNVLNFKI